MQRSAINCQDCGFSQLCLPFSLNDTELNRLDDIIHSNTNARTNYHWHSDE